MLDLTVGFLLGVMTVFVTIFALFGKKEEDSSNTAKNWDSIENVEFSWDFPFTFEDELKTRDLIHNMPRMMERLLDEKPVSDPAVIKPGSYKVNLVVRARFVKLEGDSA
jgi:hypothetical protein